MATLQPGGDSPFCDPAPGLTFDSIRGVCGTMFTQGRIVSGGTTLDRLLPSLGSIVGGRITNRTGLTGVYALELTYSRQTLSAVAPADDAPPDVFQAIEQQLGLKLVKGKASLPIFVIDHIERPSEN
jgi:uncharacterized protein (TIGR03435 family)